MTAPRHATTSYGIGVAIVVAVNILAYVVHYVAGGAFALPPNLLAVLLPLDPLVAFLAGYITHGVLTGDWTVPIGPTPAPLRPPAPPAQPNNLGQP